MEELTELRPPYLWDAHFFVSSALLVRQVETS